MAEIESDTNDNLEEQFDIGPATIHDEVIIKEEIIDDITEEIIIENNADGDGDDDDNFDDYMLSSTDADKKRIYQTLLTFASFLLTKNQLDTIEEDEDLLELMLLLKKHKETINQD